MSSSAANFKPKRTAAASRGFLATARLSCWTSIERPNTLRGTPYVQFVLIYNHWRFGGLRESPGERFDGPGEVLEIFVSKSVRTLCTTAA